MIRTTTYAYPWDLARLGVEAVVDDLADKGIAAIDLAATYHPIDALSPRGGIRLFSSARGAVHFPARPERYGRIVPSFAPDPAGRQAWTAVERARTRHGIGLNAWTVLLFQPWIADAHPDCARVLPSGDRVGQVLCQASTDVQEYYANLCADLADQFDIDTLRLEMAAPPAFDYGWLRPRVLVELTPLARQLLGVCFCPSCVTRGAAAGIDVEGVRRTVTTAIETESADSGDGAADSDRLAALVGHAELHAYLVAHEQATTELVAATVSRIEPTVRPKVSTIVSGPYDDLLGDDRRSLGEELVDEVDQVLLFPSADPVRAEFVAGLAAGAAHPVGIATFLVPVNLGVLPGLDGGAGGVEDKVRRDLRAIAPYGPEEINIYNYGLLRDRDVRALLETIGKELP